MTGRRPRGSSTFLAPGLRQDPRSLAETDRGLLLVLTHVCPRTLAETDRGLRLETARMCPRPLSRPRWRHQVLLGTPSDAGTSCWQRAPAYQLRALRLRCCCGDPRAARVRRCCWAEPAAAAEVTSRCPSWRTAAKKWSPREKRLQTCCGETRAYHLRQNPDSPCGSSRAGPSGA